MKQLKVLLLLTLFSASISAQTDRYFDQVFSSVDVTADVTYGVNATVLLLAPPPNGAGQAIPQALKVDIYEPSGDVKTDRPLVIILHTGNFLPPQVNGGCSGTRKDATDVSYARRLARMGYVVGVADYRLGWNPVAGTQTERIYTLINAAYRGVQDVNTCIRFFRKDVAIGGNNYGIDPTKITVWGIGTGGYIAAAAATLDTITDTYIPKFLTPQGPMVLEALSGNVAGTTYGVNNIGHPAYPAGDTLNYPNHVGYSSAFNLAVNLGGALGDTSWIEAGEMPIISFHNPTDPFAPCGTAIVLVPPPINLPVVEVTGSCGFQPILNAKGNQNAIIAANLTDPLSVKAKALNGGIEGFYPFLGTDSSPWGFAASSNPYGLATDPLCETHAATHDAYQDTIIAYFAPRACAVLGLGNCSTKFVNTKDLSTTQVGMSAVPNPTDGDFTLKTNEHFTMQSIEIVDIAGRRCASFQNVNANQFTVTRNGLAPGVYFARVRFNEGTVIQKVILQ
ncbi:MAG: T9SS type A sorting domain-containing protein [Phycisphaerae bacterium]|nr:T9SS type A sorting domain-containing protein [Saprospiraceae bacterium]